jgi:hypothetical protein
MNNQITKTVLSGIRELHIKILQANNLPEIGNYLQEILDKVIFAAPASAEHTAVGNLEKLSKSRLITMLKSDIKSIVEGTNSRIEIVKYKATLEIASLKRLITDAVTQ